MKQSLLMIFISAFLISGCSQKEIVYKKDLICYEQELSDRPGTITISFLKVPKNDKKYKEKIQFIKNQVSLIKEKNEATKEVLEFYEDQVIRNNNLCKKLHKEEK